MTVDIIIPTYRPDEKFDRLMRGLTRQAYPIHKIILMNTDEASFQKDITKWQQKVPVEIHHIAQSDFDHAATRQLGTTYSDADIMIFMTQDAVPVDERMVGALVKALEDPDVAVAYARQMPAKDCLEAERMARRFNYPARSQKKTKADLEKMGIKTFFCSDVCAAYKSHVFVSLGGFPERAIFNEDMVYAAKAIQHDYAVYYCAEARVIHSHNYTGAQQFHRNFDLGVSQKVFHQVFDGYPSEGTGVRMVTGQTLALLGKLQVGEACRLWYVSGCKYAGYRLGKMYDKLPTDLILKCTSNPGYFTQQMRSGLYK